MAKPLPASSGDAGAHTELPWDFVREGREGNDGDPAHYQIHAPHAAYTGRTYRVADTLNCDSSFTLDEQRANAAFIVKAANHHEGLVEALRNLLGAVECYRDEAVEYQEALAEARAILSRAS